MPFARFAIQREPLSVETLVPIVEAEARSHAEGCGALASFIGVVRGVHQGRIVHHLEYEAFDALALKVFERIAVETAEHWPATTLAIHHRTGRLTVGEASVVIVAATPHRAEAFQACRYAIERVKQIAPIWKHEFLEDGEAWIEGAAADPEDADARRVALSRARAVA